MRKRPFQSKLIALLAAGLLAGAVGGTVAAFSASTSSSGNTFSAAASFVPCTTASPTWVTGFEHGVTSTSAGGVLDYALAATADSSVKRSGNYSLRLNSVSGSEAYAAKWAIGGRLVMRFALRFPTLPSDNVSSLASTYVSDGSNLVLGYRSSDQKLTLSWSGASTVASSDPVQAGTWYVIDLEAVVDTNPRTGKWRIDGVDQPSTSSSESAASNYLAAFGSAVTGDVFTAHYDDVVASNSASDYPLGNGRVFGLSPDGIAGHNNSGNFRNQSGGTIDANSWQLVDEVPMSSTADNVQQRTASGTSYLGFTFEDPSHSCIRAISGVVAYRSSDSNTNNGKTSIFDGSTERTVYSGNMTGTALKYRSAVIAPTDPEWSQAAVSSLIARVGYSTDVSPIPIWDALLLEYETPGS